MRSRQSRRTRRSRRSQKLSHTQTSVPCGTLNHCIRATTSTVLSHSNFEHSDIIAVTGHKDPRSLLPYVRSVSNEKRKAMSNTLYEYGREPSNQGKENCHFEISSTEQTMATEIGMKMFQSNNISGGQFNINFNFSK